MAWSVAIPIMALLAADIRWVSPAQPILQNRPAAANGGIAKQKSPLN
jgi:hypothetical protein